MKDAAGHGSNSRSGESDQDAAARRSGMALHEMALRDVGRVGQLKWQVQDALTRFARNQSGSSVGAPEHGHLDPEHSGRLMSETIGALKDKVEPTELARMGVHLLHTVL